MTTPIRAPDRLPWPSPRVAVDTSEQNPLTFGYVAAAWEPNAPVHHGQIDADKCDPKHHLFRLLGERSRLPYPWHAERANLGEGDYQLLDVRSGAPIPHLCAIETKRADLVASYTGGRDRLEAEFLRMRPYRFKAIVATCSLERLVGKSTERQPSAAVGKEAGLIGSILALSWDHGVQPFFMPSADHAEYIVAFLLARAWRLALSEDPPMLAAVRLVEANERAGCAPVVLPRDPRTSPPIRHRDPNPRYDDVEEHYRIPGEPR
jgi:hypothetical protein